MKKWFIFVALAAFWLGASVPTTQAQGDPRSQLFSLVNQVRANYGLSPYIWNSALAAAAQSHAEWMASTKIFAHNQGGSTPYTRAVANGYAGYVSENIVGGTRLTPNQGVIWWENSPVHFAGMTSNFYTEAGTGHAVASDGQNMYVLVMGAPDNNRASATAPNNTAQASGAAMMVTPITLSQPGPDGGIVHTVRTGQTVWAIAARYEVRLDELQYLNSLTENSLIKPGDELIIRLGEGQSPPPTPTPSVEHTVREGETLWSISLRNNVAFDQLLWLNQLQEDSLIRPGDKVKLRLRPGEAPPPTPTPQMAHRVSAGDTLLGIAVWYGLSLDQLLAYNSMTADTLIRPGDMLWIRPSVSPTPLPSITPYPPTFTPAALAASEIEPTATMTLPPPNTAAPTATAPVTTNGEIPTNAMAAQSTGGGLAGVAGILFAGLGVLMLGGLYFMNNRQ